MTQNQDKIQTIETNSEMKEMLELGKKVKTYILIILICSKRKRNISIRRREMEDINGSPKEDKISQIEILLDMVYRRLESTEEIFIKPEDRIYPK